MLILCEQNPDEPRVFLSPSELHTHTFILLFSFTSCGATDYTFGVQTGLDIPGLSILDTTDRPNASIRLEKDRERYE